MKLFINASSRKKNCYMLLKDLMDKDDELVSLADEDIKFCLGCNSCIKSLEKHCVLNDYITNNLYDKILKSGKIVIASPLYMSSISGLLKNLLDRLYPFYNHSLFKGQDIYLILTGHGTKEENEEEINGIVKYFEGISEWMNFKFHFLDYIRTSDPKEDKDIKCAVKNYDDIIENIKQEI